jgi:DegV family protein with EDD domain
MTVAVVTDSTSDIPLEVAEELGITIVPLYVQFGKKSYRDNVDLSKEEFYQKLVQDADYPKSSTPSLADFITVYSDLAKRTDEILAIYIGSKISGTYNVAVAAAKEVKVDCRIELVDSQTTIMALGLLVIEAAKKANEGMGLSELTEMVRKAVPQAHVVATFDTLKYLYRGGHATKTQVILSSSLRVKPLIYIQEEILPFGKAIGRAKSIDALYKYADKFSNPRSLAVEYATDPDEANSLAKRLEQTFPGVPIYKSVVGAVVGAHTGPHVLTVAIIEGEAFTDKYGGAPW